MTRRKLKMCRLLPFSVNQQPGVTDYLLVEILHTYFQRKPIEGRIRGAGVPLRLHLLRTTTSTGLSKEDVGTGGERDIFPIRSGNAKNFPKNDFWETSGKKSIKSIPKINKRNGQTMRTPLV